MTAIEPYVFEPFKVIEVSYNGEKLPVPRSGHRISCDDKNIYLFGGYNPVLSLSDQISNPSWSSHKPLFKELWSFCIASREWKQYDVENMPEELASNAMCMYGSHLMIFGGTGAPFGMKCSNDVVTWDTQSEENQFKVLNVTGSKPPGLYGQGILCHDGHFYTIGGTNGYAYNSDIYRLNLRTLIWESVYLGTGQQDEPSGRYRHELARVGDKIYIIGGGTGDWSYELMELPMFDLETRQWTMVRAKPDSLNKTNLIQVGPLPRKCHSAVQIETEYGTQIFVAGGTDSQSMFDDVWRLSLRDHQWTLMQKTLLPSPLYFHSSTVTSSGCMYVFGGIEPREREACRNNKLYKVWLCVPKLSEMCWEAALHYNPGLSQCSKQDVLASGVPLQYVERL